MAGPRFSMEKSIKSFHRNYIKSEPDQCWEWIGYFDSKGYGRLKINYVQYGAHRISWAIHNGLEPNAYFDGCVLHSCDNPACVNPSHLRIGTLEENTADMVFRLRSKGQKKTHCKNGHEFNKENTSFVKGKLTHKRLCKKCSVIRSTKYKNKKREAKK